MEFFGVFVMGCHLEPEENLKPSKASRAQLEPQPYYLKEILSIDLWCLTINQPIK